MKKPGRQLINISPKSLSPLLGGFLILIIYININGILYASSRNETDLLTTEPVGDLSRMPDSWRRNLSRLIFSEIHKELTLLGKEFNLKGSPEGKRLIETVKSSLQKMESGKQRFVKTGRESSLASFYRGRAVMEYSLWKMRNLSKDLNIENSRTHGLYRIYAMMNKWLVYVAHREISARRKGISLSPQGEEASQTTESVNEDLPEVSEVARVTEEDIQMANQALSQEPDRTQPPDQEIENGVDSASQDSPAPEQQNMTTQETGAVQEPGETRSENFENKPIAPEPEAVTAGETPSAPEDNAPPSEHFENEPMVTAEQTAGPVEHGEPETESESMESLPPRKEGPVEAGKDASAEYWIIGLGALAVIAILFLVARRNKRQTPLPEPTSSRLSSREDVPSANEQTKDPVPTTPLAKANETPAPSYYDSLDKIEETPTKDETGESARKDGWSAFYVGLEPVDPVKEEESSVEDLSSQAPAETLDEKDSSFQEDNIESIEQEEAHLNKEDGEAVPTDDEFELPAQKETHIREEETEQEKAHLNEGEEPAQKDTRLYDGDEEEEEETVKDQAATPDPLSLYEDASANSDDPESAETEYQPSYVSYRDRKIDEEETGDSGSYSFAGDSESDEDVRKDKAGFAEDTGSDEVTTRYSNDSDTGEKEDSFAEDDSSSDLAGFPENTGEDTEKKDEAADEIQANLPDQTDEGVNEYERPKYLSFREMSAFQDIEESENGSLLDNGLINDSEPAEEGTSQEEETVAAHEDPEARESLLDESPVSREPEEDTASQMEDSTEDLAEKEEPAAREDDYFPEEDEVADDTGQPAGESSEELETVESESFQPQETSRDGEGFELISEQEDENATSDDTECVVSEDESEPEEDSTTGYEPPKYIPIDSHDSSFRSDEKKMGSQVEQPADAPMEESTSGQEQQEYGPSAVEESFETVEASAQEEETLGAEGSPEETEVATGDTPESDWAQPAESLPDYETAEALSPLEEYPSADDDFTEEAALHAEAPGSGVTFKALIVDDARETRDALSALLANMDMDAETSQAETVQEGMKHARSHHPDIIFVASSVLDKNGRRSLRKLQNQSGEDRHKVVVVTEPGFDPQREESWSLKFHGRLSQPLQAEDVSNCLRALLGMELEAEGPFASQEAPAVHDGEASTIEDMPQTPEPEGQEADHPDVLLLQTILKAAKGFQDINKRLVKIAEKRYAPAGKDSKENGEA